MNSSPAIVVPPRLARPIDYASPIARFFRGITKFLPSITTRRRAYEHQAQIFRMLGNAQRDLVISRAYYDAAEVLGALAAE